MSRREFARYLAISGSAVMWPDFPKGFAGAPTAPLPRTSEPDEAFWKAVRARYLVPPDLAFLNSANVAPACLPVVEVLEKNTRFMEANPSSTTRAKLTEGREESRRLLAESLGATPEEIVLVRNTSEANNFISSGLKLGVGDEVVVFGDNHPSNLNAWREKAKRFGFAIVEVPATLPHPGTAFYVDAFSKALTPRTKVIAVTHVTNTIGDMLPVKELCAMARSRGVLSVVDGAQTFGILNHSLSDMQPDFYTGSAHKWLCGPKEIGLLYVNAAVHDRISPSVVSLYAGAVGISRTMEGFGQRDEAALATLGTAVKFQTEIGRANIEKRSRNLAQRMTAAFSKMDGVAMYSSTDPTRYAAIITLRPGSLDPGKLVATLYEKERIACARSGGRPGIRFSPHIFNTMEEVDRTIAAVQKYMAS
ncbi:MAG: aminotransferase class V-fold PLP-dependent enzyme [Gemmatimonadota bacterium]